MNLHQKTIIILAAFFLFSGCAVIKKKGPEELTELEQVCEELDETKEKLKQTEGDLAKVREELEQARDKLNSLFSDLDNVVRGRNALSKKLDDCQAERARVGKEITSQKNRVPVKRKGVRPRVKETLNEKSFDCD